MKYRPELDGIRALAIWSVLVFHAMPEFFPGGFLGVDVFFVLSGFLITTLLLEQIERNLSLKHFWLKRIRRIIPAQVGATAFTLMLGAALFLRDDRAMLIEHSIAALLSLSNFFIWFETQGYWGVNASTLPLMHTWSLSVEEQFYLFYPLVLLVLYKWNRRYILPAISFLAIGSFLSSWVLFVEPSAAFLFLPFRAWEMLLGALLAIAVKERKLPTPKSIYSHSLIQIISIAALIYLFRTIKVGYIFEAWIPLLSCLATTILIYSFACATYLSRLFSHPLFVYFGKRSYSIS